MVLAVVGLVVAGLSFTITDFLPKLEKEKSKIEASINYKVFMASLNDYIIHGLRERWCFNVNDAKETDLLISDKCGNGRPMEDIVTYPGNIERILWTADNIGSTPTSVEAAKKDNRILAVNYLRYNSTPKLATRLLKYEDVALPGNKISLTIPKTFLNDMTDEHPMYMMTRAIKDCVNSVDINIFQVKDTNNIQSGDERKIGISIKANINLFRMKCLAARDVYSTSYYTFYPRRLHTFALMKYGPLDTTNNNEFHGPVYVAGDLVLPPPDSDPLTTSVFYNTLTLGVYNGGSESGGKFIAGRVLTDKKIPYTFSERGHPYLSKQDNYPGFRGFRGGLRLDATEDKGFFNLFSYTNTSAGDVDTLEACIDEAKHQTTPSLNENTILAYNEFFNSGDNASMKLSFTGKNRFKQGSYPGPLGSTGETTTASGRRGGGNRDRDNNDSNPPEIFSRLPAAPNGTVSYGELYVYPKNEFFTWDKKNHYAGQIGTGSTFEIHFNYNAFDLSTSGIDDFISNVKKADKSNYTYAVDGGNVLATLNENKAFIDAGDDLRKKCDDAASSECDFFGYNNVDCGNNLPGKPQCRYADEVDAYKAARLALVNALDKIKGLVGSTRPEDRPKMVFSMGDYRQDNKLILNQKKLSISFSPAWKFFYPFLKKRIDGLRIEFHAYNYSRSKRKMNLNMVGNTGNELEFSPQIAQTSPDTRLYSSSWRKAIDNTTFYPDPKPVFELDCPNGMGLADWDLDMSASSAFAWNYANTPSGVVVDTNDHENLDQIIFTSQLLEGHKGSNSKSVVNECIVPADRTHIYGFYVCKRLVIKDRSKPLYMIGTFIVKDLIQNKSKVPVYWHSVWDTKAADLVIHDLNASKPLCGTNKVTGKTFNDLMKDDQLKARIIACSSLDLINNGPNNFTWTTVDPDIGIAKPGDTMTSQKVNRIQKWVITEDSRVEVIK